MLIGNIMIFYVFDRYSESICQQAEQENLIVQQQAELQYYTRIIEMQEIQKEFQHDISQYLGIIRKMAEENSAGNVKEIQKNLLILSATMNKVCTVVCQSWIIF